MAITKEQIIETFYSTNEYSYVVESKSWTTDFNPSDYKRPIKLSYDWDCNLKIIRVLFI